MNPADPYGLQGQVLDGQFRVDRFVGEGGFSVVYRGHHVGLDEPIAIKCLKLPGALGSALVESFVRRFRDESRLHYRLSQGNLAIVRSIASGTTMSPSTSALVPYMVLEWLEGRSLAQEFEARKQQGLHGRSLDETVRVLDSAAQGLAFAHAQGVIHRDINPGNLFLANTRQGPITKLLDFGVAKVISDHALEMGPRAQTIGHIRIFAPAYGSPEQFDDTVGKVGPASDVYSLALIALEMMRDSPVREGEHIGEFAMTALDATAKPTPRALGIPVGDSVEEAFGRAVAMRPEDRFADVGAMWGAMKHAMRVDAESGRAPFASPVAPRGPGWKPHAPAAGQPPADRPVTADMQAPIVEVSRPGSIAPTPLAPEVSAVTSGWQPQASGVGGRMSNQTVRMQTTPSTPPPAVVSGASALGATPLTSTLMMDGPRRILTPVPPTTRTGETPGASPMAHSQAVVSNAQGAGGLGSTARMQAAQQQQPPQQQQPAPSPYGAPPPIAGGYGPAPTPPPPNTAPLLPRSEVPTVIPPKPTSRAAIAIVVALVVAVVVAGAAFAAYHFVFAQSAPAPTPAPSAATTAAPVETAPAETASAAPAVPTAAAVPTASATATAAPVATATPRATATPTPTATATATPTATPTPTPTATPTAVAAPTATPVATPTAVAVSPSAHAFDPVAARKSLDVMNGVLASCRAPGGHTGQGPINVTFGNDGHVLHAVVDEPPFAGTTEGQCVASRFKMAKVAPFEGAPGSIVYTFQIPQ